MRGYNRDGQQVSISKARLTFSKEHHSAQLGKAGRARWLGQRPKVRGLAMNACDHPHGGGRGKSKGGKDPRSVYGWLTKKRTRRSKDKDGNKM
jgi:ribosomal protein L2